MRDFQKLDPTALKAFYYAAESLNFTRAAEMAALTQSGVSQHIAKLESNLNLNLFHRANKKIRLTPAGQRLKAYAEQYLDRLEVLWEDLRGEGQDLRGKVRYAMPDSCLMTPHFSKLLEMRKSFPNIDLDVKICHSEKVIELLINGDIDFGFVTTDVDHWEIQSKEFSREEYVLVSSIEKEVKIREAKDLREMNFVSYPGMEDLFQRWLGDYFPREKHLGLSDLNICGQIDKLQGAITMAKYNVGLAIFPRHCVDEAIRAKELYFFRGPQGRHFEYPIFLIQPQKKYSTSRVQTIIDSFWKMRP